MRYVTIKHLSYVKTDGVNSFYLIIDEEDRYMEESNGNKYLTSVSAHKNKEKVCRTKG